MSESIINSNLNFSSCNENEINNNSNEITKINNSAIVNSPKKMNKKEKSKSPNKAKKKKKKKKNRHIRILCRNKKSNKSFSGIKDKKQNNNNSPKKEKFFENDKVLSKLFLIQLIKKKKMYAEKIKLMKIIKRNTSAKESNSPSFLEFIKKYSQKVYNNNKEIINNQKKRDEEREKEREKQIL